MYRVHRCTRQGYCPHKSNKVTKSQIINHSKHSLLNITAHATSSHHPVCAFMYLTPTTKYNSSTEWSCKTTNSRATFVIQLVHVNIKKTLMDVNKRYPLTVWLRMDWIESCCAMAWCKMTHWAVWWMPNVSYSFVKGWEGQSMVCLDTRSVWDCHKMVTIVLAYNFILITLSVLILWFYLYIFLVKQICQHFKFSLWMNMEVLYYSRIEMRIFNRTGCFIASEATDTRGEHEHFC